jgi:hypothetical protein
VKVPFILEYVCIQINSKEETNSFLITVEQGLNCLGVKGTTESSENHHLLITLFIKEAQRPETG